MRYLQKNIMNSTNDKKPYCTIFLICTILIVYILDSFIFQINNETIFTVSNLIYGDSCGLLTKYGQLVYYKDFSFQIWRLITVLFLHSGVVHLVVNMIPLFIIGTTLELKIGSKKFLSIFFLSGIISSCVTIFLINGAVGASGAIYGLAGFYLYLIFTKQSSLNNIIKKIGFIIIVAYLILPNLSALTSIPTHLAGLCFGVLGAIIYNKKTEMK